MSEQAGGTTGTWRPATREEIATYYEEEFPTYLEQLPSHITAAGPEEFALALRPGWPSKSTQAHDRPPKEFIRRSTRSAGSPIFDDMGAVLEFIRFPAFTDPLGRSKTALIEPSLLEDSSASQPVAEAVYYALAHHERFWVLMFDIDAKDIAAKQHRNIPGATSVPKQTLLEKVGVVDKPPEGFNYRFKHIEDAINYAFDLEAFLQERLGVEDTSVYYTGQGAHVYAYDEGLWHRYTKQSREVLRDLIRERYGIPIDPKVTQDPARVARLPYSLHADVCRIVTEIESPSFDFLREAKPAFLEDST